MAKGCRHNRAWVLGSGWLWCPECGSIRPVSAEGRWAKPGDRDAALARGEAWSRATRRNLTSAAKAEEA